MKANTLRTYRDERNMLASYKRGDRPRLLFTDHFYRRFNEMKAQAGLTADEVTDAIACPEEVGWTISRSAMLLKHGRVTVSVVLSRDGYPTAATLLWRTAEAWEASYENPIAAGRERREDLGHLP